MEQNIYSDPAHNLDCRLRFTCGASWCLNEFHTSKKPPCYIDKFKRYQPESDIWYRRNWEEVNRITWKEVFCFQESWIYTLLIIIMAVFLLRASRVNFVSSLISAILATVKNMGLAESLLANSSTFFSRALGFLPTIKNACMESFYYNSSFLSLWLVWAIIIVYGCPAPTTH